MSASLAHAAPVRFLIGTVLIWAIGRGLALADWSEDVPVGHNAVRTGRRLAAVPSIPAPSGRPAENPLAASYPSTIRPSAPPSGRLLSVSESLAPATPEIIPTTAHRADDGMTDARAIIGEVHRPSRLSGSAWAFVRGGRSPALAPGGQIGGGQAGVRLLYRLDSAGSLSATGRLSGTLGGARQTEASIGFDWKPLPAMPIHLMVERRIAIDRGGRNAWTAGAAGSVYAVPLARGWRLDGYAEAGVVGSQRRDLYADGAVRIGRQFALGHERSLTLGPGLWGAAQPGAARVDVGPSAVLRLPVLDRSLAIALDWRQRVAGQARPGSGAALTVATDF